MGGQFASQQGPAASALVVVLLVLLIGSVCYHRLLPVRATKVLTRLVGTEKEKPQLRRVWRSGKVWRLAWSVPLGATTKKAMASREVFEEALDVGVRFYFDRGLLWGEFGTGKIPRQLHYRDFQARRGRRVRRMQLPIPLGASRRGALWVDLTSWPHGLIGGTTNFGKSVFIRQALTSLVLTMPPERLRLLLVDLKSAVEFRIFEQLPHLYGPVVSDVTACKESLSRVSDEIDRRLSLLRDAGVVNIGAYNARFAEPLPYLVVVLDEVAELRPMDTTDKEARSDRQGALALVGRVTRLGRAAGVHALVCTQRPDSDTVPGSLKAQLASTVAFFCRDDVASRILLDSSAASDLPPLPGRAVYQHGAEATQLQVPYIDQDEAEVLLATVPRGDDGTWLR